MKINFLGTGAAMNPTAENTHFYIEHEDKNLFVDCGGGTKLAQQIKNKEISEPEYLFQSHAHTDHILGLPHVIRATSGGLTTILCSPYIEEKIRKLLEACELDKKFKKKIDKGIFQIQNIKNNQKIGIHDRKLTPIDIQSKKVEQHGFILEIEDKKIVFFGDENINFMNKDDIEDKYKDADRLILEAFCLDNEKEEKTPYDWHHITAKDAGEIAKKLEAKNLIVVHVEEEVGSNRTEYLKSIKQEAQQASGTPTYVPGDNTTINLDS